MKKINYAAIPTEGVNAQSLNLDLLPLPAAVRLFVDENQKVIEALKQASPRIARAVEVLAKALGKGGRVFFVGAGTSGRLGVLEAAEMPPTFSVPFKLFTPIIAGGRPAVFRSQEGAEDRAFTKTHWRGYGLKKGDVVLGVAASGVTPFVRSALQNAKTLGASTLFLTSNPQAGFPGLDLKIILPTGPELLSGSTRLKAGTAAKMALNIITTLTMVRLGKVYQNRMVDLSIRSFKLGERALRLVMDLTGLERPAAEKYLKAARGQVKAAVVMARKKLDYAAAQKALNAKGGRLRPFLQ